MLMVTERLTDHSGMQAFIEPVSGDVDLRYFVMLTEPNKELKAEKRLRDLGFDPFVPKETKLVNYGVRSGRSNATRKREVTRPLFRGYLFLPLNRAWRFGPIYDCDGLRPNGRCFYVRNGEHVVLRPCDVELLRHAERVAAEMAKPGSVYKPGQSVKMVDGPFSDIVMKIVTLDDAGRIELLCELFNGTSKQYASVDQIEPA
jgi:transcription antitermination factor NusG